MPADLEKTELRQAFEWTCDACGRDNFVRAISAGPVERQQLIDAGMSDADGGEWLMAPDEVTCQHCACVYATIDAPSES